MLSAKYLKDVNRFFKIDVYAVVSLSDISHLTQKSTVDRNCATKSRQDFPMKFTINESYARRNRLTIEVNLFCKFSLQRDKHTDVVSVSVKELLEGATSDGGDGKLFQFGSYQVRESLGNHKGKLNISYKFMDKAAAMVAPRPLKLEKKKSIYGYLW